MCIDTFKEALKIVRREYNTKPAKTKKKEKNMKLLTAKEVFDSLWNKIQGELMVRQPENLKIVFDSWSDPYESGSSGIVFNGYVIWGDFCFLKGNGYSSGRGDKTCGSVIYAINIKCKDNEELLRKLREKMSWRGWKFIIEAFDVIQLHPGDETIYPCLDKNIPIEKIFVSLNQNKIAYKEGIVDLLFRRMKKFLTGKKEIKMDKEKDNGAKMPGVSALFKEVRNKVEEKLSESDKNGKSFKDNNKNDAPDGRD